MTEYIALLRPQDWTASLIELWPDLFANLFDACLKEETFSTHAKKSKLVLLHLKIQHYIVRYTCSIQLTVAHFRKR